MGETHRFEIELTDHGHGTVKLDGVSLHGVTGLRVEAGVGKANTVTLVMLSENVTVVGAADLLAESTGG